MTTDITADELLVMLDECQARLEGLVSAYTAEVEGCHDYFGYHGAEHSDENCPEDDTCACPEAQKLRAAWEQQGRAVELAHRRIDKIKAMRERIKP